jgi:hypothetical protein
MIFTTMAVLALQVAPTLAEFDKLPAQAAGEIALAGHDHAPIVKVVDPPRGMDAPGTTRREMIERSAHETASGTEGCSRKRWTVMFFQDPKDPKGDARLSDAWSGTEVALPGPAGCPDKAPDDAPGERYVRVAGMEPAQALAALKRLDDLRLHGAEARFTCADETASNLCGDPESLRPALAKLSPWAVTLRGGETIFWLGRPGQVVTEVRYRVDRPDIVKVSRSIPAPF